MICRASSLSLTPAGRRWLRALNIESINAYCDLLRSPQGEDEVGDLLDVISTNVADFFREANRRSDLATARSAASAA
jgi:chemotaxis methyl-accepting protein methylase